MAPYFKLDFFNKNPERLPKLTRAELSPSYLHLRPALHLQLLALQ